MENRGDIEKVVSDWRRAKLSRQKKRVFQHRKSPKLLSGQRELPKPSMIEMFDELEEQAAKRIYGRVDDNWPMKTFNVSCGYTK